MKNWFATALGAALLAMAGGSSAARAATIDFGAVALGGNISYAGGATLDQSSSLDLDSTLLGVTKVSADDASGLSVFPSGTSDTVLISPSAIIYGSGSGSMSVPLGTHIFKTWTAAGDSFTEDMTTVLEINRATANAITVVLEGTVTDTGGLFPAASPVFLILTASQAGGPGNVIATSLTNTSTFSGGVPEPSTWMMMALGFGGLGYLGSRRRKSKMSIPV